MHKNSHSRKSDSSDDNWSVRRVRPEEWPRIRTLVVESLWSNTGFADGGEGVFRSRDAAERLDRMARLCSQENSEFEALAAVLPDGHIGGCILVDMLDIDPVSGRKRAFIIYLSVAAPWRDGRMARALIHKAAALAAARGVRRMAADVPVTRGSHLKTALYFGFRIDHCTVSIGCSEEGAVPDRTGPRISTRRQS